MDDLLTTQQVQAILKVDRITIYRMLQDGRIQGAKVGQQWRFARQEVERVAGFRTPQQPARQTSETVSFPTHCVQTIQDLFSNVSQIGALVISNQGEAVTQVSHPCALFEILAATTSGQAACRASWKDFATRGPGANGLFTCYAGLQYVAAPIIDRGEQVGYFLAGQFYSQPFESSDERDRLAQVAAANKLNAETLYESARLVPVFSSERRDHATMWAFAAARAIQSILHERGSFFDRLQKIANLTELS